MVTVLVGILVGLIFFAGYLINSKTQNYPKTPLKPEEEKSKEEIRTNDFKSKKSANELPFEVHPLERISSLSKQVPAIREKTLKYLRDRIKIYEFEDIIQEIASELDDLDVDPCIQSLMHFTPVQTSHNFRLELKLNEYSAVIVDIFQSLPSKPERVGILLSYLKAFKRTIQRLEEIMVEYDEAQAIPLSAELVETLIINDVKILSDEKLCRVEIEKFFSLHYGLKSYLALEPILEISLQQICSNLDKILEVLYEAKTKFTKDHLATIEGIQQSILLEIRSFTNYFIQLFSGVHSCIETLKSSNLKEVTHLAEVLQNAQTSLEEEYLPVAQSFGEGHGTLESDFHKYLQKLTQAATKSQEPQPLSVGILESSVAYFQKRSEDMRFLNDPRPVKSVQNIFNSVKQRILRFRISETEADEKSREE